MLAVEVLVMSLPGSLLGGRSSSGTTTADAGILVDAEGYVASSETSSTSYGTLACDAVGAVGTGQFFRTRAVFISATLILRVPWTLTTHTVTATARGTIRAALYVNDVLITQADGAPRNLSSADGTRYTELISLTGAPVVANAGDVVEIRLIPVITVVAAGGQTYVPTLRHDPQTVNDQLVVEIGGA